MYNVGCMLEEGEGCEQNYFAAADWFRRAAAGGNVDAKLSLGILLGNGNGVAQVDYEQANALFEPSKEASGMLCIQWV